MTESGETLEPKSKSSKKKKKPLSQNNPTKKEWTLQEAEMALKVEKELNKRFNQSLLIKFPDLELSREIVAKFHPAIEDVKFHQPHAARSCFVTLTVRKPYYCARLIITNVLFRNQQILMQ